MRPTSRLDNIADLPADRVVGDLRDVGFAAQRHAGCEFVFHVAADYRLWARERPGTLPVERRGYANILQAARESGVRRVIYTSSVATMGFGNNGRLTDEQSPVSLDDMVGDYKRSKFMAERLVIEAATERTGCRDGQSVRRRSASATSSQRRPAKS